MILETVPYYRVPRDDDGRPSRLFDRSFELALRWQADIEIPEGMVSAASKRQGEPPQHAGRVALKLLLDANDISQRQLDAALAYLRAALAFYQSNPWDGFEPYPGRNQEAAGNFRDLLAELTGDW